VVMRAVQRYLAENLPRLDARALRDARDAAGLAALLVLPLFGLLWVDSLRSSIRAMWQLPEHPGVYWLRQVIDMAVLAGLGALLAVLLALAVGTQALLRWLLVDAAGAEGTPTRWLLGAVGFVLGLAVNVVLSVAVLTALPRLHMPVRRVLGPALLVAVGLELLKTLGRLYIERTEANPAYHLVAGAVGLLVFLNALNHLILFAAALTATGDGGRVVDLAARGRAAAAWLDRNERDPITGLGAATPPPER
jgi:membrane protein